MTSIPQMDETRPLVSVSAGFGNQWFQEIQRALKTQFRDIGTGVVTATAEELSGLAGYDDTKGTVETRLQVLEDKSAIAQLPTEAYDFNDPWWGVAAVDDLHRIYSRQVASSEFINAPWPWGTNDPGGRTYTIIAQRFVNNGINCAMNMIWRLSSHDDYSMLYYRQATTSTALISAKWFRSTFAEIDHEEATSGAILYSTVCPEQEAQCP
jgi:hypothetical protein